jgi:MoaA/NifB/PqqE/SkfB family radical SAM enzyme
MMVQFEVTTRCNFDCFYCAGRTMRQGDLAYETFVHLLGPYVERHEVPAIVSLQGEGEPTLHKEFFRMAEYVRAIGSIPYTITNGTYKHPERFVGLFPAVGVSVDSLDESAAIKIGRYNLPRVVSFVQALAPYLTVVVHSVANRVHTPRIADWCKKNGYRHVVQPLQRKQDYSRRYMPSAPLPEVRRGFSCEYLKQKKMRYYTLDGIAMPCCFIKDANAFEGIDTMLRHQEKGTWPTVCVGCRYGEQANFSGKHRETPGDSKDLAATGLRTS